MKFSTLQINERTQIFLYLVFVLLIGVVALTVWKTAIQPYRATNHEARQTLSRNDFINADPQRLAKTFALHTEALENLIKERDTLIRENAFLFSPQDLRLRNVTNHHDRIQAIYRLLEEAVMERHREGDIHAVTRMTPRPVIEHKTSQRRDVLFFEIPIQANLTIEPAKLDLLFNTPGDADSLLLLRHIRISSGSPPEDTISVAVTFSALLLADAEERKEEPENRESSRLPRGGRQ